MRRNAASDFLIVCCTFFVALKSGLGAAFAFSAPGLASRTLQSGPLLRVVRRVLVSRANRISTGKAHTRITHHAPVIYCRVTDTEEHKTTGHFAGVSESETVVASENDVEMGSASTCRSTTTTPPSASVAVDRTTGSKNDDGYALILVLCFFVTVLSALDRVAMSVALVPISSEFALTDTIKGQISSVFSVGYGLAILPCGLLVAAASPRLIMASGVALWSIATIGTPLAADLIVSGGTTLVEGADAGATALASTFAAENVLPLLAVRAFMGGAESVVLPAVQVSLLYCQLLMYRNNE